MSLRYATVCSGIEAMSVACQPLGWQPVFFSDIKPFACAFLKARRRVLVGPAGSLIGTSMTAHEFGGTYRKRHYPKRPLMGPVINKTAAKLPKLWENAVKQ